MPRGGKRKGAGRPRGSGKFGEETIAMRVPKSKEDTVKRLIQPDIPVSLLHSIADYVRDGNELREGMSIAEIFRLKPQSSAIAVPLFAHGVAAGYPSTAEDYVEAEVDLNEQLVRDPQKTFIVRAAGDSMIDAGIHPGDLMVVDTTIESLDRRQGKIVIASVNNELTVKRLERREREGLFLVPENPKYNPIEIKEEMDFRVWGVVTNVIHAVS